MKTITCDACGVVIEEKELRLIARIRFAYGDKQTSSKFVVHEGMEFCSSKCIKEFLDVILREDKPNES